MNVNVHIEQLILDSLPVTRNQTPLLQVAVEAELARLLAAGELSPELLAGCAVPSVKVGNIQMAGEGNPSQMGHQIARAVYGGIGK